MLSWHVCLERQPITRFWVNVTAQPWDCPRCKARNLLALLWCAFSGSGNECALCLFRYNDDQKIHFGRRWQCSPLIDKCIIMRIVDAPFALMFRMGQQECHLPFQLLRRPIYLLCKDEIMEPFDCGMCKAKNCSCSIDTHIKHSETAFVHLIIVCNELHIHYWPPILHFHILSIASRGFVASQFLINLNPRCLSEYLLGPITFLHFRQAIDSMWIISLVYYYYCSTSSPLLIQLVLLNFHDVP